MTDTPTPLVSAPDTDTLTGMREYRPSLMARAIRNSLRSYGHKVAETSLPEYIATDVERVLAEHDAVHPTAEVIALRAEVAHLRASEARMREATEWYGEQARLCRLIHSEGDTGRHMLQADGGNRARAALQGETK